MSNKPPAPAQVRRLRPYTAPRLRRFGDVSVLTRAGTAVVMEGAMAPTGMPSSFSIKRDIVRVGEHPWGLGLYLFRYRRPWAAQFGPGWKFGVIAEEVEAVVPEAVSVGADGVKRVDYGRLGIRLH